MIEIGHNLQHAIEFGMLLSVAFAVIYIVLKYYGVGNDRGVKYGIGGGFRRW